MKYMFTVPLLCYCLAGFSQSRDEVAIRNILSRQVANWNAGDLTAFMNGYWKNDSLEFVGKSGITYGWDNTLANYKKSYPDREAMGTLTFTLIHLKSLSPNYFHVTGQWRIDKASSKAGGSFTLLFKLINGEWVIISDHSS